MNTFTLCATENCFTCNQNHYFSPFRVFYEPCESEESSKLVNGYQGTLLFCHILGQSL